MIASLVKSIKFDHILLSGIAGFIILITGTWLPLGIEQKSLFFMGASILLFASMASAHRFFVVLQTVAFIGTLTAFLDIPFWVKFSIPLLAGAIAIFILVREGKCQTWDAWVGTLGLVGIALGYATSEPPFYCLGALFLVIFSAVEFKKGHSLGLIFALLNLFFFISSGLEWLHVLS